MALFSKLTFYEKIETDKIKQPLMQHAREGNIYCVSISHDLSYTFFWYGQNDIATHKNIKGTTLLNFLKYAEELLREKTEPLESQQT